MALALEQQADRDRRQGSGEPVGGQHREHDSEPERREQVFCRTLEEDHGREHAAYRERRDQGRHRDPGGAVESGHRQRLAFLGEQAVGVLDRHGGVVHEDADCERKPAERHRVESVTEKEQHDERGQDGKRDRDHHHQRRSPGSEKEQDHQGGQSGRDRALAHHAFDRLRDEHGLVEEFSDVHACRRGGAEGLQGVLHAVDDGDRRGVAILDDAEQN